MHFTTILELNGKNNTGIVVPPEILDALDAGKKPKVTVTINGSHTYRSSVGSMGGRSLISVSAENRTKAGVAAGDRIEVDLELDTAPREVEVPADLAAALAAAPVAQQKFRALSYSHQLQHVLAVEGAKTEATRQRRVDGAIVKLLE